MATISNNADKVKKTIERAIKKELSLAQLRERITMGEVNRHNIIQLLHEYNIEGSIDYERQIQPGEGVLADPYYTSFNILNQSCGNYTIGRTKHIYPLTLSLWDEDTRDPYSLIRKTKCWFTTEHLFIPRLSEGENNIWMTVEAHEINTHNSRTKEIKGKVCCAGLGLGYTPYRLAQEAEVKSIDVIELNPNVISLYEDNIRRITPNNEKIKVIQGDAIEYLRENTSKYDCVDADIWHSSEDMLDPYLKLLAMEQKNPQVRFSYWMEKTFYVDLQCIILLELNAKYNYNSLSFQAIGIPEIMKALARYIIENTKGTIYNVNDLSNLLSYNNLREKTMSFALDYSQGEYEAKDKRKRIAALFGMSESEFKEALDAAIRLSFGLDNDGPRFTL